MKQYGLHVLLLAVPFVAALWGFFVTPYDGSGPGATAPPGVRENPTSWRAVYVPYVRSNGSGGGGYSLGK